MDLLFVGISVLLFLSSVYVVPQDVLRLLLGLPFVLFLPGYAVQAAFLPRGGGLDGVERVALSFGLSLALVPLIGLALHFSPWGLHLGPIVAALAFVTLAMAGVAYLRRRHSPPTQRTTGERVAFLDPLLRWWRAGGLGDKAFAVAAILVVVGVWGGLVYAVSRPPPSETFTEFYILGPTGTTEGYPSQLRVDTPATLHVGIVNRELQDGTYTVEILLADQKVGETPPLVLRQGEKWEGDVTILPTRATDREKLQVLLLKDSFPQANQQLYLWVTVRPAD